MADDWWWVGVVALAAAWIVPLVILPDRKWDRVVLWIDGALTVTAIICYFIWRG